MASQKHRRWYNKMYKASATYNAAQAAAAEAVWFPSAPTTEIYARPNLPVLRQAQVSAAEFAEERPLVFVVAVSVSCGALASLVSSVLKPFATVNPTNSDAHDFLLLLYSLMRFLVIGECSAVAHTPPTPAAHTRRPTACLC